MKPRSGDRPNGAQLSVVVPAKNAAASIGAMLESISQERDVIREVLIVDDGSSDRTSEIALETGRKLDLPVAVIPVSCGNAGAARNAGIAAATGELLFLLDADDEVIPGGLRALTDNLRSANDVDVAIGGYIRRTTESGDKRRLPHAYGRDRMKNADDYLRNRHRSIAMGSALVRRKLLSEIRFPETADFDEDTVFWASILSQALVSKVDRVVMIYNVDGDRMERRLTAAPFLSFSRISRELTSLGRSGFAADTLDWRKGWLARRIARALFRAGRYDRALVFMRVAAAQHPRIRTSVTTFWYRTKIHFGSALSRLR